MLTNEIYNMDCVEGMKLLPDNCIDLTVTSPPYDDMRKYNGFKWNFEATAQELYRITKQGGVVVWVVGDKTIKGNETGTSFKQALFFKECGFNLHDTMIYQKAQACFGSNLCYLQSFEYMFVFSKGKPKTINLLRDRENKQYGKMSCAKHSSYWEKGNDCWDRVERDIKQFGKRKNIWTYSVGNSGVKGHPAVFPEQLAQDHILSWSNEGDLVLDPFIGSGTTAKMALLNKRNYIGFELSKDYCNIANKRIEDCKSETRQLEVII